MTPVRPNSTDPYLKQLFCKYLTEVRGLSARTVEHYLTSLNVVTGYLRDNSYLGEQKSLFEVADLDTLLTLRNNLLSIEDFRQKDERGNRMYTAGLNNYLSFAQATDFGALPHKGAELDLPRELGAASTTTASQWGRSSILRRQALESAHYQCSLDETHETFEVENTCHPYMESHHAISLRYQSEFSHSLDVGANLVCLCPLCHRKLHYARLNLRKELLVCLYDMRAHRLDNCGLSVSKDKFISYGCAEANTSAQT